MSKKHFEEYLNSVYESYLRLEKVYKAYQEECERDMVEPERLQQIEDMIKPVKDSYNSLRYVKYLLDMPNKKSKTARYTKQNSKLLNSIDDRCKKEAVIKNNDEIIDKTLEELS